MSEQNASVTVASKKQEEDDGGAGGGTDNGVFTQAAKASGPLAQQVGGMVVNVSSDWNNMMFHTYTHDVPHIY